MPCEFCPADQSYCCVCQDTPPAPEILTPRHLYDVALGSGFNGVPLSKSIANIQGDYGALSADQLEAFIQGWQEGSQDQANYAEDMKRQPVMTPEEQAEVPF